MSFDALARTQELTDLLVESTEVAAARLVSGGDADTALSELAEEAGRWMIEDLDRALVATERLVALGDAVGGERARSVTRRARAQALAYANRHEESLDLAKEAVDLALAAERPVDAARARVAMMQVLDRLGRAEESIEVGRTARSEFLEAGEEVLAARAEANLGVALRVRNQPRAALACFDHAREVLGSDPRIAAQIDSNRAEALLELNEFEQAEGAFRSALAVFVKAGMDRAAAIVEGNLADLMNRQGRLHRAMHHFERVRRFLEADAAPGDLARLSCEQAEAFEQAGLAREAVEGFRSAIPQLDRHHLAWEAARARTGLGRALLRLGRRDEADSLLAAAAAAFESLDHGAARARVLLIQGELAMVRAKPLEARVHFHEALALLHDRPADAATARHHLAELAISGGDFPEAENLVDAAIDTARKQDIAPLLADLLHTRAKLRTAQSQPRAALSDLESAVAEVERLRGSLHAERVRAAFFGQRAAVYEDLVAALLMADDARIADAFGVVERAKSRALLDLVAGVIDLDALASSDATDPASRALIASVVEARSELNVLYSRVQDIKVIEGDDLRHWRERVESVESRLSTLESRLTSIRGAAAVLAAPIGADATRAMLDPATALIEYFAVGGEMIAFVVRHDGLRVFRSIASTALVEELVEDVQFQIDRAVGWSSGGSEIEPKMVEEARGDLQNLHDVVFAPLLPALAGVKSIVVVPHGPLHAVPFHALHSGDSYLIEQFEITYAPSASVLSHFDAASACAKERRAPHGSLVVGVADDDAPEIEDEVREVASILETNRKLFGESATAGRLAEEAPGTEILHLACHARFAPEAPFSSGVKLADGWMTVREICQMDLGGSIVVLSGCATGCNVVDRGDELGGLVRGFAAAGARALLTSLWALHDRTARGLVCGIYREWSMLSESGGASLAGAVRSAQLDVMRQQPHPAFWAPFILVGRP